MDLQQELGNNFERPVILATDNMQQDRKREYSRYRWAASNMTGASILDIGCSSGFAYKIFSDLRPGADYKGIDYDAKIVEFARSQFGDHFEQGDINTYDMGQRDAICAFEVIEHVDRGREIAQELKQHCSQLFLTVPYNETPGFWGQHHKLHRLTQADFPGFEYSFMNNAGEIRSTPWDDPICIMLMYWDKELDKDKLVSIIVTNHNYGEFFDECIDSIRNQTYKPCELIVVDDASTDGSAEFGVSRADLCIRLYDRTGPAGAKLEGLKVSKGEYCCFIDADDAVEPEYIARCVAALKANPRAAIAYTDFWHCGDKDNGVCFPEFSVHKLEHENYILGSSLFRRKAYDDTDGLDVTLLGMEDYDLWLAMIRKGWEAVHVPGYLYRYRAHGSNFSNMLDISYCFRKIWKKHWKRPHVTAEIATKDRYQTTLPMAILAILQQTRLPDKLVIIDDGEDKDPGKILPYPQLFRLAEAKGVEWYWMFGKHKGQHYSHEMAQDMAEELVWRTDDDVAPEPTCLERLLEDVEPDVGCVGGLALTPPVAMATRLASNKIEDVMWAPNKQWFRQESQVPEDVDHLHCTFLYRKGIAHYDLALSPVAHTEETLFTYAIKRAGYRVLLEPKAVNWHLRNPEGGIRSYGDPGLWQHDEQHFRTKMLELGIRFSNTKFIFLNNGLGDHLVFKQLIPELQAKFDRIVIACCYPEVFEDCDKVETMSIAEADTMVGDGFRFDIYRWMADHDWHGPLIDIYRGIYGI